MQYVECVLEQRLSQFSEQSLADARSAKRGIAIVSRLTVCPSVTLTYRGHIRRCSTMTLDSDNIRFMRIFAGVPWKGGVIQQWDNRKRVFFGVSDAAYSAP